MSQETILKTNSIAEQILQLKNHLNQKIIGQEDLVLRLLIALLSDGHLLVEGAPGLAKTRAVKELAASIKTSYHRVQFTPDLLPADLTGTEVYRPQDASFHFQQGPIFHNIILADEINRAPAKVQSALLEAMAERQVTVGRQTYALPELFMVMATQNPIEQEGTYPLPEAQLDRFIMHTKIDYPDSQAEFEILQLVRSEAQQKVSKQNAMQIEQESIFAAREEVLQCHVSPAIEKYMVQLVIATRKPQAYSNELAAWVRYGASPRATIALDRCARAHAWLIGRDYVTPEDIHAIAFDVLRHRILLTFAAQAEGIDSDAFITQLLKIVPVP